MLSGRKKDVVGILVWWECGNKRNSKSERKWERRRKGSSTGAKVFQFSALKHEPTPQLGCPGKLLNKTFIIENTVACVLSRTCKLSYSPVFFLLHFCSRKNPITTQSFQLSISYHQLVHGNICMWPGSPVHRLTDPMEIPHPCTNEVLSELIMYALLVP